MLKIRESSDRESYARPAISEPEKLVSHGIVRVHCADNVQREVGASLLMNSSTCLERILSGRGSTASGDVFKIEVPIKSAVFDLLVSYFSSDCIALSSCLDAIQLNAVARNLDLMALAEITRRFICQNFAVFVQTQLFEAMSTFEMLRLQELPFIKELDFDRKLFVDKTRRWTLRDRKLISLDFESCDNFCETVLRRGSPPWVFDRRDSVLSTSSLSSWMSSDSASDTSVAVLTEDNGTLRLFRIQDTHAKEYSCKVSPSVKPCHPTDAVIVKDKLYFVDRRGSKLSSVSLRTGGLPETVVATGMNISHMTFFNNRLYVSIVDEVFVLEDHKLEPVGKSTEYILEFVVVHHSESGFQFIHRDITLRLHHITCERPNEITTAFESFQADWLIGADGSQVFTISSKSPKELMVLRNFQRILGLPQDDTGIGRDSVCSRGQIYSCATQRNETFVNVLNVETKTTERVLIKGRNPVLLLKASNKFKS